MSAAPKAKLSTQERSALEQYRWRTRRLNRGYGLLLAALLIVVLAVIKIAYAHGELTRVSAQTGLAPTVVSPQRTAASLTRRWQSSDQPAAGNPAADGIVVTFAGDTVRGRDIASGAQRWHYTRKGQSLCSVLQQDSSTIAIYNRHGNCDEVTGLVTATGVPKFFRTLPDNGVSSVASAPNVVMIVTKAGVHVFDNAGGIDRWTWSVPAGCTVHGALTGGAGVLISYVCPNQNWLMLHAGTEDKQLWSVSVSAELTPLSADSVIAAANPATSELFTFSLDKGSAGKSFNLGSSTAGRIAALPAAAAGVTVTDTAGVQHNLLFLAELVCLDPGRLAWTVATAGPATVGFDGSVTVLTDGALQVLQPATGKPIRRITMSPPPTSGASFAYGAGVVLAGAQTAYYS